jgi:hypothetical protein
MNIKDFTSYARDIRAIHSSRHGIPVISGSLVHANVEEISGYENFAGTEAGHSFDFKCNSSMISLVDGTDEDDLKHGGYMGPPSSTEFGCAIEGSVKRIAAICSHMRLCKGFTYYARGFKGTALVKVPFNGNAFGVLKSEKLREDFLNYMGMSSLSVTYLQKDIIPKI